MSPLGWLLAVFLVAAVGGLVVVPYIRADVEPLGPDIDADVRYHLEEALRREYCLECGGRVDPWTLPTCPHCGAVRGSER